MSKGFFEEILTGEGGEASKDYSRRVGEGVSSFTVGKLAERVLAECELGGIDTSLPVYLDFSFKEEKGAADEHYASIFVSNVLLHENKLGDALNLSDRSSVEDFAKVTSRMEEEKETLIFIEGVLAMDLTKKADRVQVSIYGSRELAMSLDMIFAPSLKRKKEKLISPSFSQKNRDMEEDQYYSDLVIKKPSHEETDDIEENEEVKPSVKKDTGPSFF